MNRSANNSLNLDLWNEEMSWIYLPSAIIITVCFVVGFITNSTVVLVFALRLRHSRDDRYFIPFLSTVDLFGLVVNLVGIWVIRHRSVGANTDSRILCRLQWYVCSAIGCFSAFLLIGIAIQRYLKVCRPCGKQMTLRYRRLLLIVAFVISTSISIPFAWYYDLFETTNRKFNATGYVCKQKESHRERSGPVIYSITIASLVFVNILCLVILYSFIGRAIYQQTNMKKKRRSSAKRRNNLIKETNIDSDYPTTMREETSYQIQNDGLSEYCDWTLEKRHNNDRDLSSTENRFTTNMDAKSKTKSLGRYYQQLNKRVDRFTCMFLVITAVAMVSYIPKATMLIVESLDSSFWDNLSNTERSVAELVYRLHVLHHTSNALIYGYFDTRFRKEIKNMLNSFVGK